MRTPAILLFALLAGSATAQEQPDAQLANAKAASAAANARANQLDRAGAREEDASERARLTQAALTARATAAEADIAVAEARMAVVRGAVVAQQQRLAAQQGPVARLLAALQSLAARPTLVALAQPGSVDDLVHVRAVLGSTIPAIRARTAEVRSDLDRSRGLQQSAALATAALREGRTRLERNRLALVRLEADQRLSVPSAGDNALRESDQALALGEQARDIVGLMDTAKDAAEVEASLATLAGPLPRPGAGAPEAATGSIYRLPAAGRIVTGFGELSDTGVRSRGLTLVTGPGAHVVAPAGGQVLFAGAFRQYGRVVVIDHGAGWTSALIGLAAINVRRGDRVAAGAPLGRATSGEEPRVTVELRRRGRPIEPIPLIG